MEFSNGIFTKTLSLHCNYQTVTVFNIFFIVLNVDVKHHLDSKKCN